MPTINSSEDSSAHPSQHQLTPRSPSLSGTSTRKVPLPQQGRRRTRIPTSSPSNSDTTPSKQQQQQTSPLSIQPAEHPDIKHEQPTSSPPPSPPPTSSDALTAPTHITLSTPPTSDPAHPSVLLTIDTLRTVLPPERSDDDDEPPPRNPWTPTAARRALEATLAHLVRIFAAHGLARQSRARDPRGYYRVVSLRAQREHHRALNADDDDDGETVSGCCVVEAGFASGAAMMAVLGALLVGEGGGEAWRVSGVDAGFYNQLWDEEDEKMMRREERKEDVWKRGTGGVKEEGVGGHGVETGAGRDAQTNGDEDAMVME